MKGHVEIFTEVDGKQILLYEESNLIVDGAGETIVDMLTFSPGFALSSNPDDNNDNTIAEAALDTSNFVIQGMTFAKGETGYKTNLHTYTPHNLIPSADNLPDAVKDYRSNIKIVELPDKNVIDGSSTVYSVSSLSTTTGGWFGFSSVFDSDYIGLVSALPKVFTIDVKMDLNEPPSVNVDANNAPQVSYVIVEVRSGGEHYIYTTAWIPPHRAQNNSPVFIGGNLGTIFPDKLDGTTGSQIKPYAAYKDQQAGWYKVACLIPGHSSYASNDFDIKVYPMGSRRFDRCKNISDFTGKMLFSKPSLNIGSLPVNYFLGSEDVTTSTTDFEDGWQFTPSSIVTKEDGYYLPNNIGTVTNSTIGYNVSASLPSMPHPNDKVLEPNTSTAYEDHIESTLPSGHNLNMLQLVGKTYKKTSDFWPSEWLMPNSKIPELEIQKDFRWFGCFPDQYDPTAYLVSEVSQNGYETTVINRASAGTRFNDTGMSSMDYKGYLRAYYQTLGEASNNTSKLLVSALPDFSSTGKVTYSVRVGSSDVEMANCFGGIFDLGLYTLNSTATREKNGLDFSRSIDKTAWTGDDLEFRLFAQKSMNYDITHRNDFTSASPLYIYWTIDFL